MEAQSDRSRGGSGAESVGSSASDIEGRELGRSKRGEMKVFLYTTSKAAAHTSEAPYPKRTRLAETGSAPATTLQK